MVVIESWWSARNALAHSAQRRSIIREKENEGPETGVAVSIIDCSARKSSASQNGFEKSFRVSSFIRIRRLSRKEVGFAVRRLQNGGFWSDSGRQNGYFAFGYARLVDVFAANVDYKLLVEHSNSFLVFGGKMLTVSSAPRRVLAQCLQCTVSGEVPLAQFHSAKTGAASQGIRDWPLCALRDAK